jgi:hypothetical protein
LKDKPQAALEMLTLTAEPNSVGEFISETEIEKNVTEVKYNCSLRGYQNWYWSVVFTQVDKRKPATISEVNLVAGEGALLAPAWVPWAERLADFRKQLKESGKAKTDSEADAMIREITLGFGNHGEADDAENDADNGGVKPPLKTRVRQRRIKRSEDQGDDSPDDGAA